MRVTICVVIIGILISCTSVQSKPSQRTYTCDDVPVELRTVLCQ